MHHLRAIATRFRSLLLRDRFESEVDEELTFHLRMETEKNLRAGMSPEAARRAAQLAFGGAETVREDLRDGRLGAWVSELARDVRLALRTTRRAPAFALAATATLALGIGAATAIFGVVDAAVLRPLPFPEGDRLVHVWETTPDGDDFSAAAPNYLDFRARSRSFTELAAFRIGELAWSGRREPERLQALWASHTLLAVLGVQPVAGRGLADLDDAPGSAGRVALIGHDLWSQRFAGDRRAIGRTLILDGEPHTVVGVLPPAAALLGADVWLPLAANPASDRDDHWLSIVGRLAPGATAESARADLTAIAAQIGAAHPEIAGWGVRIGGLEEWLVAPRFRRVGVLLLGAVGLLLLMACANVAGLLVARTAARQTELGVRAALGAGRGRLLRQLLTESAVLTTLGGGLGLLGAAWILRVARSLPPTLLPRADEAHLDARVALFALGAALLTCLLVGAVPASAVSRADLRGRLAKSGRSGMGGQERRLREALVVGQLAVAVVLLLGAGLMARSLQRLQQVDPGFATTSVWSVPLQLPETSYPEPWQRVVFYYRAIERVAAVPGVQEVGGTSVNPFSNWNLVNDVTPEESAAEHPAGLLQAAWRAVTPGYFDAAGVPLLRGRDFTRADRHGEGEVVIVSRSLAERLWPGREAVGQRVFWGGTEGDPKTVIGVAGDVRDFTLDAAPMPMMFLPIGQIAWPSLTLVVRTRGEIAGIESAVRKAVWEVDAALPVPEVLPMAQRRAADLAERRLDAVLLGAFAVAALLLAIVGVYGVLAYALAQRRREIAVRMALGAAPAAVTGMLLRRGLQLTAAGVGIGLLAAAALTQLLEGLLFETRATDPVAFTVAPGILAAVALLATLLPALRAARTDPMLALRQD
jgi:putative ABC transport system permease protein